MPTFLRLPGFKKENPNITFYTINVDDIRYFRGWSENKGSSTTYGSVIFFKDSAADTKDSANIKVDVPEPQLVKMLKAEGVNVIGLNEV